MRGAISNGRAYRDSWDAARAVSSGLPVTRPAFPKFGVSYGIGRTLSALAICQLEEYQIETAPLAIFANFLQT